MREYKVIKAFATQGGDKSELVLPDDHVFGEVRTEDITKLHIYHSTKRHYMGYIKTEDIKTYLQS